jgi:hypothetical protein
MDARQRRQVYAVCARQTTTAGHDEQSGGNQLRGAETGGGPKPIAFFGFSVPT